MTTQQIQSMIGHTAGENLKSFLDQEQQNTVVVIRYDQEDRIRTFGVQDLSEVVAELHMNGFSESMEGRE